MTALTRSSTLCNTPAKQGCIIGAGSNSNHVLRMRGGGFSDLASTKPISNSGMSSGVNALPRSLETAVAAIERWWLVALLCILNIEVAWRGGLLSLLVLVGKLAGIAFTLGRLAAAVVFGAWAFEKIQLAIQRGQRPPTRTALLTYPPFSVVRSVKAKCASRCMY